MSVTWVEKFLTEVFKRGVITLHSSSEYDSFNLVCDALARIRRNAPEVQFRHIVKLAEPSFDDNTFVPDRLQKKVDAYCRALGCDRIDNVQWMWRRDLDADPSRVVAFRRAAATISESAKRLKDSGQIGRWFCFPYSLPFGGEAVLEAEFDGLVIYRNRTERQFEPLLDEMVSRNKACFIIRPFLGGELLAVGAATPRQQLDASLDHPAIEGAILSTSNLAHLDELLD